jgi:hypothetical protein
LAFDERDPAAVREAFVGSAQSARRFATGAAPTTAYQPAEKAAAGDRFANVVRKVKRELKKAIVDDINL